MINRRSIIRLITSVPFLSAFSIPSFADAKSAMKDSALIYLTPIKSDAQESKCQAEVWFAHDGVDMYVCTGVNTWRAKAAANGLNRARIWVGDLGEWKGTQGKYKTLPQLDAEATVVIDKSVEEKALQLLGDKYSLEWIVWGPRFRKGLSDGSRVMLRYRPLSV
jgi:hypothetical protein